MPKNKKYDSRIWEVLKQRLPFEKSAAHTRERENQWMQIDVNGNGLLSLAEVDKGLRDIIRLPALFNAKPVIQRAFTAAKTKVKSKSMYGDDYIQKSEYRFFLKYLRMYYEYWVAFDLIDLDGDKRLTFKEFQIATP